MKRNLKILLFCAIAFSFIGCDQLTKNLAKAHLMHKAPVSYLNDTFRLEYAENTGAFLSLGADWSDAMHFWFFTMIPVLLMGGLFCYALLKSKELNTRTICTLALLFAGGTGNLIDRILYDRHVADFMNLGFQEVRTGIFNFADVYITAGVLLMLVFYRDNLRGTPVG